MYSYRFIQGSVTSSNQQHSSPHQLAMSRSLQEYWSTVDQSHNLDVLFLGPVHEIDDPKAFPSVSSVINESSDYTGVRISPGCETAFDAAWLDTMKLSFEKSVVFKKELDEYLETGLSNGRKLRLQVMVLPPGMYFKIHAHPNIEFEVTLKGTLHEFRWSFYVPSEQLTGENPTGPEIAATQLFEELHVKEGGCMMNSTGSVHQSFTAKDLGCTMVVLWSGCHANVHPSSVKSIDPRLRPTGSAGWQ